MKHLVLIGFLGFFMLSSAGEAQAARETWLLSGCEKTQLCRPDFQPYTQNAHHPHNHQWETRAWTPGDWAAQRNNDLLELINDFYDADILRDQYMDGDLPVLEIGPNFYRLGHYDQRRITETIDAAYHVTSQPEAGFFMLYDWYTSKPIGIYDKHGLQMQ